MYRYMTTIVPVEVCSSFVFACSSFTCCCNLNICCARPMRFEDPVPFKIDGITAGSPISLDNAYILWIIITNNYYKWIPIINHSYVLSNFQFFFQLYYLVTVHAIIFIQWITRIVQLFYFCKILIECQLNKFMNTIILLQCYNIHKQNILAESSSDAADDLINCNSDLSWITVSDSCALFLFANSIVVIQLLHFELSCLFVIFLFSSLIDDKRSFSSSKL